MSDNDRRFVIGHLALWFGVDTNKVQVLPDFLHELVEIPLILGTDWNIVRVSVNDIKLFNRDLIDLVQDVNAGNVDSVTFDNVD